MTKKKDDVEIDLDNEDLELDDFPEFGDDDFPEFDDNREPDSGEIAKESLKEAGSSFLSSLILNTSKKSLPDEYTTEISSVVDYADIGKEIYRDSKDKLKRSSYLAAREVSKILPFESKLLNKLVERLTPEEETYQPSEEEQREASIQSNLSSIFDKQIELQKALEAKRSAEENVDRKERLALGKFNLDTLSNIDKSTSITNSFHLNISKEYFRKSLELQYKSYFVQADLLKVSKEYFKTFVTQFEKITKNTSLPDYVKLHDKEAIAETVRQQTVTQIFNSTFSNNNYLNNVKNKLKSLAAEKVSEVTDAMDNISDMLANLNDVEDSSIKRNIFSSLVGGVLGEKASEKISPFIKNKIGNNEYVKSGANYLSMLSKTPSSFFSTMNEKLRTVIDENEGETGIRGGIIEKGGGLLRELLTVMEPGRSEYKVKKESILNHNKPAIFDKNVHRSITDVIPMYLRKILKETTNISRMTFEVNEKKLKSFSSSNELHYDYRNRKLDTIENIRKNTEGKLFNKDEIYKNKAQNISSSIRKLTNENLTKKEKSVLNDNKLSSKFEELLVSTYKEVGDNININNIINENLQTESVKKLINENPNLKQYIDIIKKTTSSNKDQIETKLKEFSFTYPISGVIELFKITSKLSGSRIINKLNPDEANIVSKSFHSYIVEVGKDITFNQILNGSAFKYLSKKEVKPIMDKLKKFVSGVRIIYNLNDISKISSFEYTLSVVNSELRNMTTVNPEVFQTLYDLNPELQEAGTLTTDNFIDRKLGIFKKETNSDIFSELKEIINVDITDELSEMRNITRDTVKSVFSNKFNYKKIKQDIKNEFKDIRSVNDLVVTIERLAQKGLDRSKKVLESKYTEAKKSLDDLSEELVPVIKEYVKNSSSTNVNKVKESLLTSLTKLENNIDTLIEAETTSLEKKLEQLNTIKSDIESRINDPDYLTKLDGKIFELKKRTNKEIEYLKYIKKNIRLQKTKINNFNVDTGEVFNFLREVKSGMDELKDKFKNVSEKLGRDNG